VNTIREALRLGAVVTLLGWIMGGLPLGLFFVVTGVLPGLWWSSAAWDVDDIDLESAALVVLLAGLPLVWLSGADRALSVIVGLWIGAALARVRLRPARVPTVTAEDWARRNAHRYRAGRAERGFPDMVSSDPYSPLFGWRRRPMPPAPLEVPPEHELHLRSEPPP
jgi:hypothetical protein